MERVLALAASAALLAVAVPAYARSFSATVDCSGVYAPGDEVPFDVTVEDLDDAHDMVFVTITLEVPGSYNNQLVVSGVVRLGAGEVRSFHGVETLGPNAPAGSYSMFLNASSDNGTDITICDFEVR